MTRVFAVSNGSPAAYLARVTNDGRDYRRW
jgi:hypothetical protein